MGHGHVFPNPDGSTARCGGPSLCDECSKEQASLRLAQSITKASRPELEWAELQEKLVTVVNDVVELRLRVRDPEIGKFLAPLVLGLVREHKGRDK